MGRHQIDKAEYSAVILLLFGNTFCCIAQQCSILLQCNISSKSDNPREWITFELGKPLEGEVYIFINCGTMLQPMWIVPTAQYVLFMSLMINCVDAWLSLLAVAAASVAV